MAGLNHQLRGELDHLHRLRAAQSALLQNIPIKMKKPTSIRKVIDMMATVRNASPADRGVIACLARCEAP